MNKQTAGGIEMSDKILPCPFCGCETIRVHKRTCDKDTPYNPADRAYPLVRCYGCGASAEGDDWTGIDTAINRWNRRAPAVPVMGEAVAYLVPCQTMTGDVDMKLSFEPSGAFVGHSVGERVPLYAKPATSITQAELDAKDALL